MTPAEINAVIISLKVALCAVLTGLPFAIVTAYILARKTFFGRTLFQGIIDLPLVLPPVVTGFLLLYLLSPKFAFGRFLESVGLQIPFTWIGAVLASAIVSFPLMVRSIRTAIQSTDPQLALVARTLGASRVKAFTTVTIPLARHGIVAGALLGFARSIGEFGATIMIAGNIPGQTQTIPLAIYNANQRVGGFQHSWRLVVIAIVIALVSVAISEYLERRRNSREQH